MTLDPSPAAAITPVATRAEMGALVGKRWDIVAPAKLNLRIKLEGRRDDGFHLLSMFNVLTSFSDTLQLELREGTGVSISGVEGELADSSQNLASRAAEVFLHRFEIPLGANIALNKQIPMGAGFGGGSSDAGSVLWFLYSLFRPLVEERFKEKAVQEIVSLCSELGSDIPFFFHGKFARVTGIGERVERYDARFIVGQRALLVMPHQGVATAALYSQLRSKMPDLPKTRDLKGEQFGETLRLNTAIEGYEPFPSKTIRASLWRQLLGIVENDFEPFILDMIPEMRELFAELRAIPDAVVSFTGSGSAMFVLARGLEGFAKVRDSAVEKLQGAKVRYEETELLDLAPGRA